MKLKVKHRYFVPGVIDVTWYAVRAQCGKIRKRLVVRAAWHDCVVTVFHRGRAGLVVLKMPIAESRHQRRARARAAVQLYWVHGVACV